MNAALPSSNARDILLIASESAPGNHISARLRRDGHRVQIARHAADSDSDRGTDAIDGLVLQTQFVNESSGTRFLGLTDETFGVALAGFIAMVSELQRGIARMRIGGSVVVITSRGYLGTWAGAHEAAISAATVALLRCVSLESAARGIRANALAVETAAVSDVGSTAAAGVDELEGIADVVAFLISAESRLINGEVLLANRGRSLRMREARNRD